MPHCIVRNKYRARHSEHNHRNWVQEIGIRSLNQLQCASVLHLIADASRLKVRCIYRCGSRLGPHPLSATWLRPTDKCFYIRFEDQLRADLIIWPAHKCLRDAAEGERKGGCFTSSEKQMYKYSRLAALATIGLLTVECCQASCLPTENVILCS